MKKSMLLRALSALLLTAMLTACSSTTVVTGSPDKDSTPTDTSATTLADGAKDPITAPAGDKSLNACTKEVIDLLLEMTSSDDYLKMYNLNSDNQKAMLEKLRSGSYTTPSAVYEITVTEETINLYMKEFGIENLSDNLKKQFISAITGSIVTRVNSSIGTDAVAIGSVLYGGNTYLCSEVEKSTVLLYVYENGNPIMITVGDSNYGVVGFNARFLMSDSFPTDTAENIQNYFYSLDIGVSVVKK